eukprot:4735065-Heterocapsa_arctica.AAC.1
MERSAGLAGPRMEIPRQGLDEAAKLGRVGRRRGKRSWSRGLEQQTLRQGREEAGGHQGAVRTDTQQLRVRNRRNEVGD